MSPISIAGSGTITGISAGGLPDDCITTAEIAANAVTTAKLGSAEASGLAKAWVNFNGTGTVAIRASYNVSSITDNGTGDYTVNFTTALADANYSVVVTGGNGDNVTSGVEYGVFGAPRRAIAPSTSSIRIGTSNYGASVMDDFKYMYVAIFR
jgi:hypothetical protein